MRGRGLGRAEQRRRQRRPERRAIDRPLGRGHPGGHWQPDRDGREDPVAGRRRARRLHQTPDRFKSYDGVPGKGGKVNVFTIAYQPPPPPRDQNEFWQELEKRLGVTWEPIITPQPDYGNKSAALIAGGSLPELFYLNPGQNAAPQYKAMDQGAFLDLTPYVTGDALKEYKNLATFPDYMWNNVKFKSKVYGVPKPLQRNGNIGVLSRRLGQEAWQGGAEDAPTRSTTCSWPSPRTIRMATVRPTPGASAGTARTGPAGTTPASPEHVRHAVQLAQEPRRHHDERDRDRRVPPGHRVSCASSSPTARFHPDSGGMTFAQCQAAYLGGKIGAAQRRASATSTRRTSPVRVYFKIRQANPKPMLAGLLPDADRRRKGRDPQHPGLVRLHRHPAPSSRTRSGSRSCCASSTTSRAPFGSEEWRFLQVRRRGRRLHARRTASRVLNERGIAERGDLVYVMAEHAGPVLPARSRARSSMPRRSPPRSSRSALTTRPGRSTRRRTSPRRPSCSSSASTRITGIVTGRAADDRAGRRDQGVEEPGRRPDPPGVPAVLEGLMQSHGSAWEGRAIAGPSQAAAGPRE